MNKITLPNTKHLVLDRENDLLTVLFNRPEVKNALSNDMAEELASVFETLAKLPEIRFVVLRGKDGAFCSGGDLKLFKTVFQSTESTSDIRQQVVEFNASFGRTLRAVEGLPQLFIVLIEGVAMAGGLGISCIADVVITTADAKFALTEVSLGIPPAQITPLVINRIGVSQARRLLLTAQRFDGNEAARLGFAHFVVKNTEALNQQAKELIDHCRTAAPGAVSLTKEIIKASARMNGEAIVQFAAERFADAMLGPEGREGMLAFTEKRRPNWAESPDQVGNTTSEN